MTMISQVCTLNVDAVIKHELKHADMIAMVQRMAVEALVEEGGGES